MKVLGISCGRKYGNSEILTKEALKGVEELGIGVDILRLLDLEIKPCKFCKVCPKSKYGPEACIIKDDSSFLWNTVLDYDGLIITAPVYSTTPPGYFFQVFDRVFERNADVAGARETKKAKDRGEDVFLDERVLKTRVGGLISLGGSVTANWLAFGINLIYTRIFSFQLEVVDQIQVLGTGVNLGQVLLNNSAIARAHKLGRNVGEAFGKPLHDLRWMGDDPGTCPVCHNNLLMVTDRNPVECPICGIRGELTVEDGRIKVTFSEQEQKRSRLHELGKLEHFKEYNPENPEKAFELGLTSTFPKSREKQLLDEIARRRVKYDSYIDFLKPSRKKAKQET